MKYLVVIEHTDSGYSAFSPDLDGCVATGATEEEVSQTMSEAIQFHLDGLKENGSQIPKPHSISKYVEIPA